MSVECIKVIFGAAWIGWAAPYDDQEYSKKAFQILKAHGVETLDTAQLYGQSEKSLGELKAGDAFSIDTKWPGGLPQGWATRENILKTAKESLEKIGVKQVSRVTFEIACTALENVPLKNRGGFACFRV